MDLKIVMQTWRNLHLTTDYTDYAGNLAVVKGCSLGRIGRTNKVKS